MAREEYPYKETAEIALEIIKSRNLSIDSRVFHKVLTDSTHNYDEEFVKIYPKIYQRTVILGIEAMFNSICTHRVIDFEYCDKCGLVIDEIPF